MHFAPRACESGHDARPVPPVAWRMRIVVTGAASPLGRAVVAGLVQRGHRAVGVVRRVAGVGQMELLGAEPFLGDVRDPGTVARALARADAVYHLAGFFDFWEPASGVYESVNVGATRNVLAAAVREGVRRVLLCSSAITIGEEAGALGDEFSPHRGHTRTRLERSKLDAERVALRARGRGVEVVVVNPGLVVAPGDTGWTGRLLRETVAGRRPLTADAPLSWVWVGDAAHGVLRAGEAGADGARYILSGEVSSSRRFLGRVATSAGARAPRRLPGRLTMAEAALATAVGRAARRRPALAMDEARFLTGGLRVDGSFAAHELGIEYTPSSRYIPGLARDYRRRLERFERV